MNNDFATVITLMTIFWVVLLLVLWRAVTRIQFHIDQAVYLIRQQRNEDLRWHRDSLLAHLRADTPQRR